VANDGLSAGDVSAALEDVPGVTEVTDDPADDDGVLAFSVAATEGTDVRPDLFSAAVDKGWQLSELHRERESLEDVFRRVTRGEA